MQLASIADNAGESGLATAALLAFELCQRQADVLSLTWDQIEGNLVSIVQSKTGSEVQAEIPEYLYRRLALQGRAGTNVVLRSDGEPWRNCIDDFRRKFRHIANEAGLPQRLTFMDLRRSGITEMADAGATDNEILSVSGHKTREILKVYAKTNRAQAAHGLEKRRQFVVINGALAR
jgi:integrase